MFLIFIIATLVFGALFTNACVNDHPFIAMIFFFCLSGCVYELIQTFPK